MKNLSNIFTHKTFFIRLLHWEYWPMTILLFPVLFYWLYFSLRARSGVFFSAANPGIDMGGLAGESKMEILKKFPSKLVPQTLVIDKDESLPSMIERVKEKKLAFPLIAKPDVGERGFKVEKVESWKALEAYSDSCPTDFLLQEYIDLPVELGILYYRFPGQKKGHISSVTIKEFLTVVGDGKSTVHQLILAYPRAKLQYKSLKETYPQLLDQVPDLGEKIQLVPIGNHARGATFLNGNSHIDSRLVSRFDELFSSLDGIYFGRLDLKCNSIDSIKRGEEFYILEFNGVKSEPTHIYHPGFSLWEAYRVMYRQWKVIYQISIANHKRGIPYDPLLPTLRKLKAHQAYKKSLST